ncbi:MAG: hypothetical protein AB1816_01685 [Bacillota bacterium]
MISWVVRYPDQVLLLPVDGCPRAVRVAGARREFRRYSDAVRHLESLLRTWPGLKVELLPAGKRGRLACRPR